MPTIQFDTGAFTVSWTAGVSACHNVSFGVIPSGVYTSGTWEIIGTFSGTGNTTAQSVYDSQSGTCAAPGGDVASFGGQANNTPFDTTIPVTAAQLAVINGLVPGTLLGRYKVGPWQDGANGTATISHLYLTLVASSPIPTPIPTRRPPLYGIIDPARLPASAKFIGLPLPSIGVTRRWPGYIVKSGRYDESPRKPVKLVLPIKKIAASHLFPLVMGHPAVAGMYSGSASVTPLDDNVLTAVSVLRWPRVVRQTFIPPPKASSLFLAGPSFDYTYPLPPRTFLPLRIRKAIGRTGR